MESRALVENVNTAQILVLMKLDAYTAKANGGAPEMQMVECTLQSLRCDHATEPTAQDGDRC
jgi:hypothetical protein